MDSFRDFKYKTDISSFIECYNQSFKLSRQEKRKINEAAAYMYELYTQNQDLNETLALIKEPKLNEGVMGSVFGGLTGFALGKSIGKLICKTLGVEKGLLYDLLTSRVFGAALGSSIGKQF